jgi:hypothetical protein
MVEGGAVTLANGFPPPAPDEPPLLLAQRWLPVSLLRAA